MTWDGRAEPEQVRAWLEALRLRPHGGEYHALQQLYDQRAAPVARNYLHDADPHVADMAMYVLGGCGNGAQDGADLLGLARAQVQADQRPPAALLSTLTELEVPGTAQLLRELLQDTEPGTDEELPLLDRLTWLRDGDGGTADRLLHLVRERGLYWVSGMAFDLASALLRVGSAEQRAQLADIAVEAAVEMLQLDPADIPSRHLYAQFQNQWTTYYSAARQADAPELPDVLARINTSPAALATGRSITPVPAVQQPVEEYADRVVPRQWMRRSDAPVAGTWPPAKFLGQPDWRDEPAWPVTETGDPLMFYAQLPLRGPDERTAYVFLDGPDEWDPLGPGNAVVVQPGNQCHLTTTALRRGPQEYTWRRQDTYRRRTQRIPHPEIFIELVDGNDPLSWDSPVNVPEDGWARDDERNWNKIGGTPRWLQGEQNPPGEGWVFLAQFSAGGLATERADGAECYLWQHPDGRVAFGWQCH